MASGDEWCTIESDPGVFTELLEQLGCPRVELQELWSLDEDSLAQLTSSTNRVYGLIFLFQWIGETQKEHATTQTPLNEDDIPSNLFFAHQVTTNACATQAILSVVLNADLEEQELGSTLATFQSFTASFPPNLKGVAISSSDEIRTAHNAFGRTDAFLHEGKIHKPTGDEEAFHFVAYVPQSNVLYELDGLQKGPIVVDTVGAEEQEAGATGWLDIARKAIQDRMQQLGGEGSIKFNLMAVIEDKRVLLESQLADTAESDPQHDLLLSQIRMERDKRELWKAENQRRRHNYVPLCVQLLEELARDGSLRGLIEAAKTKLVENRRRARELKQKFAT